MLAEAANDHSKAVGHVEVKTPTVTNVYITYGKIEEIKSKKEGEPSKKKITLGEKCDKGLFGRSYFVVIETKDFSMESNSHFKISFRSKSKVLSDVDSAIKIMIDNAESELLEIPLNNFFNDKQISNHSDFENKAIKEFCFNRETEENCNTYRNLISESANNSADIYLKIDDITNSPTDIKYFGDNINFDNSLFNYEKSYQLLRQCFCDRDMTEDEVLSMITILNKNKEKKLFDAYNCKIRESDKTYKRLTEELNATLKKYNINTCNRKAHFVAQLFHESAGFSTSEEYAEGKQYELKNWEDRQAELDGCIISIKALKPKIDAIITKLGKAKIDETKSQIKELNSKIPADAKLTDEEKTTIANYKAIFEKKWKPNLDEKNTETYNTKEQYEKRLNGTYSEKRKKYINGVIPKIDEIKESGNTSTGDGPRYKGKGLIQNTWRSNYVAYFKYIKGNEPVPDAVKNKSAEQLLDRTNNDASKWLATDLYYAMDSAGWFWLKYKKIDKYADYDGNSKFRWNGKDKEAIYQISFMVNGGENGLNHRKECYELLRNSFFKIKYVCVKCNDIK